MSWHTYKQAQVTFEVPRLANGHLVQHDSVTPWFRTCCSRAGHYPPRSRTLTTGAKNLRSHKNTGTQKRLFWLPGGCV